MTREEAIKILEYPVRKWSMEWDEREDGLSYYEAIEMAISALRQQEQTPCSRCGYGGKHLDAPPCTTCPAHPKGQERNEPLTLDELREMDGEPVWCVSMLSEQSEWAILKVTEMSKTWFIAMAGASCGYGDKDTYGKTWLAYRQKPEEGTV